MKRAASAWGLALVFRLTVCNGAARGDGFEEMARGMGVELPKTPWHLMDVHQDFTAEVTDFARAEIELEISEEVGAAYNLYIAAMNGHINGQMFYIGVQTHSVGQRADGSYVQIGEGGIFSRWSADMLTPLDKTHVDMPEDGLWASEQYEGAFCGVRRPFLWTCGKYTFTLVKEEREMRSGVAHRWVAFEITDHAARRTHRIGRLLFEGDSLALGAKFGSFVEIYGELREIPKLNVAFGSLIVDGTPVPVNRIYAWCPPGSVNVARASFEGRSTLVEIAPENLIAPPEIPLSFVLNIAD